MMEGDFAPDAAVGHETPARARITARAGDAVQRGREFLGNIDPGDWRADVEDTIRGRPLLSVCVAVAIGFVIGRMIRD